MNVDYPRLNALLNAAFTNYLHKVETRVSQLWKEYMDHRVYNNTPNAYLRTEALYFGFDAAKFADSFSLQVSPENFRVNFNYVFDNAAVAAAANAERGSQTINDIMVPVTLASGKGSQVPLATFLTEYDKRKKRGTTPLAYNLGLITGALGGTPKGSFSVKENPDAFAEYFIAGPNRPDQPQVYRHLGNKGIVTSRDDHHEVITDFLIALGLLPTPASMNPPHGGGDWFIEIDMIAIELTYKNGNISMTSIPPLGALIEVMHRAAEAVARGGKGARKYSLGKSGREAYSVAKAINDIRLFQRWSVENITEVRRAAEKEGAAHAEIMRQQPINPLADFSDEQIESAAKTLALAERLGRNSGIHLAGDIRDADILTAVQVSQNSSTAPIAFEELVGNVRENLAEIGMGDMSKRDMSDEALQNMYLNVAMGGEGGYPVPEEDAKYFQGVQHTFDEGGGPMFEVVKRGTQFFLKIAPRG